MTYRKRIERDPGPWVGPAGEEVRGLRFSFGNVARVPARIRTPDHDWGNAFYTSSRGPPPNPQNGSRNESPSGAGPREKSILPPSGRKNAVPPAGAELPSSARGRKRGGVLPSSAPGRTIRSPERTIEGMSAPGCGLSAPRSGQSAPSVDLPPITGGTSAPRADRPPRRRESSAPGPLPGNREADGGHPTNTPRTLHTYTGF